MPLPAPMPLCPPPPSKKGEGEAGYIKGGTTVRFIRTSSTFQLKSSYNLHNKVLYTTFLHQKFGGVKRHHSNCSQSLQKVCCMYRTTVTLVFYPAVQASNTDSQILGFNQKIFFGQNIANIHYIMIYGFSRNFISG